MGDEQFTLLLGELRAIRAQLDRLDRAGFAVPATHRLVVAIAEYGKGLPFMAKDLIRHGREVEPALLAAIEDVCGKISSRSLGRKLTLLARAPIAGYQIERLTKEKNTWLFKVGSVSVSDANPPTPLS